MVVRAGLSQQNARRLVTARYERKKYWDLRSVVGEVWPLGGYCFATRQHGQQQSSDGNSYRRHLLDEQFSEFAHFKRLDEMRGQAELVRQLHIGRVF